MIKKQATFPLAGTDQLLLPSRKSNQKARLHPLTWAAVDQTNNRANNSRWSARKGQSWRALKGNCQFHKQLRQVRSKEPEQSDKAWPCWLPWQSTGMRSDPGATVDKIDNSSRRERAGDAPCGPTGGSPPDRLSSFTAVTRGCEAALDLLHTFGSSQKYGLGSWPQEQGVGSHA